MSNLIKTELKLDQAGVAEQIKVEVKNGVVNLEFYQNGELRLEIKNFTQEMCNALGDTLVRISQI